MARYRFGPALTEWVMEPPSDNDNAAIALPEATGTFWNAESGGDQYTDLLDSDQVTPRSDVETDASGFLVAFYGPDEVRDGWLDFGAGRRFYIVSLDWQARQRSEADQRYLAYVDVTDGLEGRPPDVARVIWIGGMSQPVNMEIGDVWLAVVTGGS